MRKCRCIKKHNSTYTAEVGKIYNYKVVIENGWKNVEVYELDGSSGFIYFPVIFEDIFIDLDEDRDKKLNELLNDNN